MGVFNGGKCNLGVFFFFSDKKYFWSMKLPVDHWQILTVFLFTVCGRKLATQTLQNKTQNIVFILFCARNGINGS